MWRKKWQDSRVHRSAYLPSLHAVAMDAGGKVVHRRKLGRGNLVERLSNQEPCLIGMEACAGAHHLARQLAAQGHAVRLMPASM